MAIEKDNVKAFYDTGAMLSAVDQIFVSTHPEHFTLVSEVEVADASGKPVKQNLYDEEIVVFRLHKKYLGNRRPVSR
jgi:hypothetical protein